MPPLSSNTLIKKIEIAGDILFEPGYVNQKANIILSDREKHKTFNILFLKVFLISKEMTNETMK